MNAIVVQDTLPCAFQNFFIFEVRKILEQAAKRVGTEMPFEMIPERLAQFINTPERLQAIETQNAQFWRNETPFLGHALLHDAEGLLSAIRLDEASRGTLGHAGAGHFVFPVDGNPCVHVALNVGNVLQDRPRGFVAPFAHLTFFIRAIG